MSLFNIGMIGTACTPSDTDFFKFLQHTEPGAGAVSAVDYSGDSETDELIKISTLFRVPPPTDMDALLPKIKK